MNTTYVKIVKDSITNGGCRLTTIEMKYWRAIHSEVMTHRDRARNAMSSRAIPFYREGKTMKTVDEINALGGILIGNGEPLNPMENYRYIVPNCTYAMVKKDMFIPEFIGYEQSGMQSGGELAGRDREYTETTIKELGHLALNAALSMFSAGCHKSIINRYLEPWSYITVVMSATEWKNFFRLRIHPKAEKHFNQLATMIKKAMDESDPVTVRHDDWHLPYIDDDDWNYFDDVSSEELIHLLPKVPGYLRDSMELAKRVSAARCARVSYLTHDGVRDFRKDIELFDTLIHPKLEQERDDDVIHSSPLEHVGRADYNDCRSGPFRGWHQFRKDFPNENVEG